MTKKIIILTSALSVFVACNDKLDLKPNSNLVLPTTVQDFENLLDNAEVMNKTTGLLHASSDEYRIKTPGVFNSLPVPVLKASYIWQKDIFGGLTKVEDWTLPYNQVFIANSILDVLTKRDISHSQDLQRIKGWALFCRAYAFYNLASTFAKAYDPASAGSDLGIPLKVSSSVTETINRASLKQTYEQIVRDAAEAGELLQQDIPVNNRNRPSKVAAYSLLSRIFLSMREYNSAEIYAEKALQLFSTLIDYNTLVIKPSASSFTYYSEETIYYTSSSGAPYNNLFAPDYCTIDEGLVELYHPNDLRSKVYIRLAVNGNYALKGNNARLATQPFTGLAIDEIYLIKSECLARKGDFMSSMNVLNTLLLKRWNPNATIPAKPYQVVQATTQEAALAIVLTERRKSLIYRNLRWTDLKRLNLEGRHITLTRTIGDKTYTLEPNSSRYASRSQMTKYC